MRFPVTRVLIALLVSAAAARAQEPAAAKYVGRPISDVTIAVEGKPTTEAALVDLLETRAGRPLSMADVRETIAHFQSLGRFEQVQLDAELSGTGVVLRYLLEPTHAVSRVEFRGELGVSEGTLREWLSSRFGETPPAGRAPDVASTLAELYRDHGYMTATVRAAPPVVEGDPRAHDPGLQHHGRPARADPERHDRGAAARSQGARARVARGAAGEALRPCGSPKAP